MVDLQQARREAAQRFHDIGMSYLPSGWTFAFRKSLSGHCNWHGKHIVGPKPVTRKSLYIWLHECAHAHLHSGVAECGRPRPKHAHVREMEAEQWAHAKMREHKIPVPVVMTVRAKAYVARRIREAEKSGCKTVDRKARKFAGVK